MTLPALVFGILVSTLYGALFHLIRGGGAGRLLLYLIISWLGFWAGHAWGGAQGWDLLRLGPLQLGAASGGSLLLLTIATLFSFYDEDEYNRPTG